jgi:membrane AbrB-like protein
MNPLPGSSCSRWVGVVLLLGLAAVATALLFAVHAPTAALFGPLLAGAALSLGGADVPAPPVPLVTAGQAVIGVTVGTYVQTTALQTVAANCWPVLVVAVSTLGLSVGSGLLLSRWKDVDRATASFSMIAGGASGLTAISRQLGADERLVAVIQYLRVVLVVAITPLTAGLLFPPGHAAAAVRAPANYGGLSSLAFVAICCAVGLALARGTRLPAGSLLGPMVVAGALSLGHAPFASPVPPWVQSLAFAVIGAQIGLRFTVSSLRRAGRVLPAALLLILGLIAVCAALGLLLAELTGLSPLDGYLATTPGGLYVVLATAATTHADTTFVVSVQVLRLVVMLCVAPVLARVLDRSSGSRRPDAEQP